MTEHNKYYWEIGRNGFYPTTTGDDRIPAYYVGSKYGYEARKVIEDFNLSYNVGTAVTYCLRAKRKHSDGGISDIKKAIAHLSFELEKLTD